MSKKFDWKKPLGLVLFLASFALVYWNEAKLHDNVEMDEVMQLDAENSVAADIDGEMVSLSGPIVSEDLLGDGLFIEPAGYLAIARDVESYKGNGWSEVSGDAEIQDFSATVRSANIGIYNVDITGAELAGYDPLSESLLLDETAGYEPTVEEGYFYVGEGSMEKPVDGDLRMSYKIIPNGTEMTVVGTIDLETETITVSEMFLGAEPVSGQELSGGEYFWAYRLLALVMMWLGMWLMMSKVAESVSNLPMVGEKGKKIFVVVTLVLSLIVNLIATLMAKFISNVWFYGGIIGGLTATIVFMRLRNGGGKVRTIKI